MKKKGMLLLAVMVIMLVLAGCGKGGIEGTWVLTEEHWSDGTIIKAKDLEEEGIAETYEISEGIAHYTLTSTLMDKPISIDFAVVELGDNKYEFQLDSGFVFAEVTVKGNTMSYLVGEGEDASEMIFKRQ